MFPTPTSPESVTKDARYWLDAKGHAFPVSDHLMAAQYAKAGSDEYEKQGPWGFADMWRRGWARIHVHDAAIEVDNGPKFEPNAAQKAWLKAAVNALEQANGKHVQLSYSTKKSQDISSTEL